MSTDWASPGAATTAPAAASGNPVQTKDRSKCYQRIISFLLVGLSVSMTALGVLAILEINLKKVNNLSEAFIACYMILFAVLLFSYEMMWWCTIDSLNVSIRKNFGFMYKVTGKALYIIFVALLCLGIDRSLLDDMQWVQWFTGILWLATGFGLLFLRFFKKDVFNNYQSPTGGFTDNENAGVQSATV